MKERVSGGGFRLTGWLFLLTLLYALGVSSITFAQTTTGDPTVFVRTFEGRSGDVVSAEGDYNLGELGDVTITSPQADDCLRYNGSAWVNSATCGGAGSGIGSLNSQAGSTQTLVVGTSGSDFAISSAANTHTFHLPTASGSVRGALAAADWTTFNSKQAGDGDLTAIAALSGTGFAVRSGSDAWVQRSIAVGSSKISLSNGSGASGNPTLDVVEANVLLQNLGGAATRGQLPSELAYEDEANSFSAAQTLANQNELRLAELTSNGSNYVALRSVASRSANYVLSLAVTGDCTGNSNGGALTINSSNEIVCSDDDGGGGGGGDEVSVNGAGATGANFINTTASGTVPGITWVLGTGPDPDTISISAIGAASATEAGILTVNAQTIAGQKTLTGGALLIDSGTKFYDDGDATKLLRIQVSGITTGTERTWTAGDASGEVSLLAQIIEDAEIDSDYSGVGECDPGEFVAGLSRNAPPTCAAVDFSDLAGVPATLAYQDEANVFTALQTINLGATPSDALLLAMAQPGSNGTRDSHNLVWRGTSYDGAGHNADWKAFVDVTSNAAASTLLIQSRVDSGSYVTRLSIGDNGFVSVAGGLLINGAATDNRVLIGNGTTIQLEELAKEHLPSTIAYEDEANTFSTGAKQTFQPSGTTAGIRILPEALPSSPSAGDLAIDSGDGNALKFHNGSAWLQPVADSRTLAGGAGVASIGDLSADRTINLDFAAETGESAPETDDLLLIELAATPGSFRKVEWGVLATIEGAQLLADKTLASPIVNGCVVLDGITPDSNRTSICPVDPTQSNTFLIPDFSVTFSKTPAANVVLLLDDNGKIDPAAIDFPTEQTQRVFAWDTGVRTSIETGVAALIPVNCNLTITSIRAAMEGGTSVTFNVEERSTYFGSGTDTMGSEMVADADEIVSSFSNDSIDDGDILAVAVSAVSGSVTRFAGHVIGVCN